MLRNRCVLRAVFYAGWLVSLFLVPGPGSLVLLAAEGQLPSLFRGVVVAEGPVGVRVVRVEETSQAYLADLRPGMPGRRSCDRLPMPPPGRATRRILRFFLRREP